MPETKEERLLRLVREIQKRCYDEEILDEIDQALRDIGELP